jgi:hypothetical protein
VHLVGWCSEYVIDNARNGQHKYPNTRLRGLDKSFTFTFTYYTVRAVTTLLNKTMCIIIIIIIIITLVIIFMHGIYTYIPETNHVSTL